MTPPEPSVPVRALQVEEPAWHDPTLAPPVALRALPLPVIDALAAGDLAAAQVVAPVPLGPYLASERSRGTWRIRSAQLREHPDHAAWITRAITLDGVVVGMAGFHGPPERGMVEIGYSVAPERRRAGVARATFRLLRTVAAARDDVHVLRATVSPGNAASRGLIESEGLVEVGEQWDEEDGLEIVYEAPVRG